MHWIWEMFHLACQVSKADPIKGPHCAAKSRIVQIISDLLILFMLPFGIVLGEGGEWCIQVLFGGRASQRHCQVWHWCWWYSRQTCFPITLSVTLFRQSWLLSRSIKARLISGESTSFFKAWEITSFKICPPNQGKKLLQHCKNLPLLLFSRANIDEVETDVVEIEAKLDKVRHVTLLPSALCICWPSCLSSLLLAIASIKAACISHMLCTSTVRNTKKPKTNHPTYLEWNVFLCLCDCFCAFLLTNAGQMSVYI